jgi:hypothetical protein
LYELAPQVVELDPWLEEDWLVADDAGRDELELVVVELALVLDEFELVEDEVEFDTVEPELDPEEDEEPVDVELDPEDEDEPEPVDELAEVVVVLQGFCPGKAIITGTVVGMLGTWHLPFWKIYPTSQTHSLPLKKALVGQTGVEGADGATEGVDTTVGADGAGAAVTTGADGAKIFLIWFELKVDVEEDAEVDDELDAVDDAELDCEPCCPMTVLADGAVITVDVVVVDVETDPWTHFPADRINPSLLEQVLHATPPSL